MTRPTVYGPSYSVYTRIVRLALEEKGTPYEIADVAMMSGAHTQPAYLKRNPFGKLPAFAHGTLSLYETGAITRYVDRAFDGPALQPSEPQAMALVDQVISVVDSYAYACMIGVLAWQRLIVPMSKGTPDEPAIEACLPRVNLCLSELARLLGKSVWFGGDAVSLADLHLAPVMAYAGGTPEGAGLLDAQPELKVWWGRMSERPSMARTQPQFG